MQRLTIRFPDELHERVKLAAREDKRSFGMEVLWLIEHGLNHKNDRAGQEKGENDV